MCFFNMFENDRKSIFMKRKSMYLCKKKELLKLLEYEYGTQSFHLFITIKTTGKLIVLLTYIHIEAITLKKRNGGGERLIWRKSERQTQSKSRFQNVDWVCSRKRVSL